ncbi:MAG TPA: PhaM family polyhydroxyalkanoate granule multifunctional regulatory protein [Caldimonas sp.]|nr:PhaM family polyhydroxyalkanoate granule multifunctional regulatory protein [Caldimonas sp.]
MSDGFGKLVPGFDFLQNLVKSAGSTLPGIGQWVAPTLDPAEIEKRINELRTVQYWLEQNARMLAATIQALEVQRMTLTTLKTMNVPMADLTETLRIRPARAKEPAPVAAKKEIAPPLAAKKETAKPNAKAQAAVDPMQWWGALTTQFAQLATNAMKDTAADAAKALASGMVKQSLGVAGQAMKTVAGAPARVVAGAAGKTAGGAAAKRKRAKPRAKSVASTA